MAQDPTQQQQQNAQQQNAQQQQQNQDACTPKQALETLMKYVKSGKLPKELYDLIMQNVGKGSMTENNCVKMIQKYSENFVRVHRQVQNPDPKEVTKVFKGFEKRKNEHGMFSKNKWSDYVNSPLNLLVFDYHKVYEKYIANKL